MLQQEGDSEDLPCLAPAWGLNWLEEAWGHLPIDRASTQMVNAKNAGQRMPTCSFHHSLTWKWVKEQFSDGRLWWRVTSKTSKILKGSEVWFSDGTCLSDILRPWVWNSMLTEPTGTWRCQSGVWVYVLRAGCFFLKRNDQGCFLSKGHALGMVDSSHLLLETPAGVSFRRGNARSVQIPFHIHLGVSEKYERQGS